MTSSCSHNTAGDGEKKDHVSAQKEATGLDDAIATKDLAEPCMNSSSSSNQADVVVDQHSAEDRSESFVASSANARHSCSSSSSFLSQLRRTPRTPTARYSFDDHQDYFHRLQWEALQQNTSTAQDHVLNTMASPDLPTSATGDVSSPSTSSPRSSSASTVLGDQIPTQPKPCTLQSNDAKPTLSSRKRSNSVDETTTLTPWQGSFSNGRYTCRPRHAHPGPPSISALLKNPAQHRGKQAGGRARSNSHSHDPLGWAQRAGFSIFADAGIPGLPHPAVLAAGNPRQGGERERGASVDASGMRASEFENTIQPWDSPRVARRRSLTVANAGAMNKTQVKDEVVPPLPVPGAAGAAAFVAGRASVDASDLPASTFLQKQQTRASQPHSVLQTFPSGGDDDHEERSGSTSKPTFKASLASNYFSLYSVCDRTDMILLIIGTIAAIGSGVPLPLIGILFGQLIDGFNSAGCGTGGQPTNTTAFLSSVNDKVSKIAIIAAVNFLLIWTYTTCWSNVGERIVRKMRKRYLRSVLRQDMTFFDTLKPGEVGTRLSADLLTIQNGTSEKMGILISSLSYFATSYIVAFVKLPKLAGQLVSLLPAFAIVSVFGSRFVAKAQKNTSTHLSHAASLAAEALNNLAVVQAFGSQARLSNIYQSHLELARKQGTIKALAAALVMGSLFFVAYSANALAFFSGSNLIAESSKPSTVGSVYTVIFLLLDASFIVGQIAPYLQTFSAASGAGQALRETIAKKSEIDATDLTQGYTPAPGDVKQIALELNNVEFTYPARPEEKALRGLSISVPAGHRVALVGLSGSGKSTVASLIQRFYDPTSGSIALNGSDLRSYNVRWLRSQIGVVGQEAVLFDSSVLQSIAHGLLGSPAHAHLHSTLVLLSQVNQESTSTSLSDLLTTPDQLSQLEEIKSLCEQAAKLAGAHNFITKLPHGYDTQVGQAGGKLSGGQKQRVSIARAIVKQPKLLILDEATAALDSRSEEVVAKALDGISQALTTLAIAHRLATVREYDEIVVMGEGRVLERGTHKELLKKRGVYYKLALAQDTGASGEAEKAPRDGGDGEEHGVEQGASQLEKLDKNPPRRMDDVAERDESQSSAPPVDSGAPPSRNSTHGDLADGQRTSPCSTSREGEEEKVTLRYPPRLILGRILSLVRLEYAYILLGLLTSAIMGGSYSGEAVLFGHVIEALNPQCHSPSSVKSSGRAFGLYFFILALIQLLAYSINGLVWGLVAERLLFRLRRVSFNAMLDQRLSWYDSRDEKPASMIASLSNDANNLGGVTGTVIGTIFCIFINLIAGISVSLAIAWRIAIVILALVPIILAAGYLRLKVLADFQKRHETAYVKSNSLAIEAVQCIKTVASLGREEDVMGKFERSLEKPYKESMRHFLFGNVFLALALSISYFIYAFAYWWGSQNIAEARYSQTAFFIVLPALLFSAQASGQLLAFAPDFSKAHVSAANLFRLMDQRPSALAQRETLALEKKEGSQHCKQLKEDEEQTPAQHSEGREDIVQNKAPSTVEFDKVSFTYPTRQEPALKQVSFNIPPATLAAFVGESGSGKTTAMSLIENFYTPSSGTIKVNGLVTNKTPDQILRRDMAIVPQEPVIFYGTVRFNILLGLQPDLSTYRPTPSLSCNKRRRLSPAQKQDLAEQEQLLAPYREDTSWQTSIPDSVIHSACQAAGIHDTIMSFSKGYETLISSSQLSGGQKQRLSIARALVRKPRLLLLDESTSALDSQSEQAFQETLQRIKEEGKCTILAIAHRMRTIKDADIIFLFNGGQVEASGSYASLLRESEAFRAMVSYQSLN
ncbi:hypothetical protein NDA11_007749 [Ustilago hordei]|nr:hypothetical protein NDA11_007749 [Ustilago hordei]